MTVVNNIYAIETTDKENEVFDKCASIIEEMAEIMEDSDCNELMCLMTGTRVTVDDLMKISAILNSLMDMDIMHNAE